MGDLVDDAAPGRTLRRRARPGRTVCPIATGSFPIGEDADRASPRVDRGVSSPLRT